MIKKTFSSLIRMDAKLVVFVMIALLPLVVAGCLALAYASRILEHQVMDRLQVVADSKAQRIESYLLEKEVDVTLCSQSPTVLSHLESLVAAFHQQGILDPDHTAAALKARGYFTRYTQLKSNDNVLLVDTGGNVIFSVFPTGVLGKNLRAASYKNTALAKVFDNVGMLLATENSDYETEEASGEQKAYVAAPVFKNGVMAGTVVFRINNQELFEIAADYTGLGDTGETLIGRRENDAILVMAPTRYDPAAAFHRRITLGSPAGVAMQEATRGNSGIGEVLDYRGARVLAAWKYLPTLRCGLVVKQDAAEAFAPIQTLRRGALTLGILATLLVVFLAPLAARRLSAPLRDLARTTRAFSAGDLTRRARIISSDETGDLAAAFNQMAGTIQQQIAALSHSRDELEGLVEKRTADLGRTNRSLQTEIDERKRAEETLRMFQFASDNAADEIFWLDRNAGFYYVNDEACRSLGYTREELMRLRLFDIDSVFPRERWDEVWKEFETGKIEIFRTESCHRRKDGSVFPVEVMSKHVFFGNQRMNMAITRDITERKQMEAELTRERDLLRSLLDQSLDKIYFKDTQSRFIKVSQALATLFGVAFPEDMVGKTDFDYFTEEHARPAFKDEQEIIRTGVPIIGKVEKEVWQDGRGETWALTTKMPFRNKDGQIVGTFGITKDITALKKIENALAYERDLFKTLMDQSPDSIYFKDIQSRFLRFSQSKVKRGLAAELARYRAAHPDENEASRPAHLASEAQFAEYLVGKTDFDLFLEAHARPAFEDEQEIIRTGIPMVEKVEKEVWLDGHETWVLTSKMPFRDKDGRIVGTFGVSKDITAMKEAEAKLAREQARFQFVFDSMPVGAALYRHYPDGRSDRIINDAHLKICGLTREQDQMPGIYKQITHPEDAASQAKLGTLLDDGRDGQISLEKRYLRLDGKVVWVVFSFLRRNYADGGFDELSTVVDITERKRAEEQLRQLSQAVEQSPVSIVITDLAGNITYVNPKFTAVTGYSFAEVLGKNSRILKSGEMPAATYKELWNTITSGKEWRGEFHNKKKNGELYWESASISPILNAAGKITHFLGVKEDTTERKLMEVRLFQSQKMETVGKLAGGIAHEFNSILTAIIGQSEFLLADLPAGSPLATNVNEISKAAGRAATLTRQLLAYGRKQFLRPEILDLNQVIAGMDESLRHLMGTELVVVEVVPAQGLKLVRADAGQIEQVIVNLVMNARDAMPNGGKLTLETANIIFDNESVGRYPELKPGGYVMLAVSDTGRGMSEKVRAHAFEPFFTTKDVGQGTGLGLSTCYGIVKQSGGHISVYSEQGRGTTFKIYLPQVELPPKAPVQPLNSPGLPRGTETILLVEDDPALREMAADLLRRLGYTVLAATNGVEALSLAHQPDSGRVDLLFTDVVMPHMGGKELAGRVRALNQRTKILFTSAYTEQAIIHQGVLDKGVELLQKPFTPSALAHKVRAVLDAPVPPKPENGS